MLKKRSLFKKLKKIGIRSSDTILIHSSFKRLGKQKFEPKSFLVLLEEYMKKGTIVFPTFTWKRSKKLKRFNFYKDSSESGILSEKFRNKYPLNRSFHPTHSLVAKGKNSDKIINIKNSLIKSPCGKGSSWEKLLKLNTKILLIDTLIDSCTLVHYFEEKYNSNFFLSKKWTSYICKKKGHSDIKIKIKDHRPGRRSFYKFFFELQKRKQIRQEFLGEVSFICFDSFDLEKIGKHLFLKDKKASF